MKHKIKEYIKNEIIRQPLADISDSQELVSSGLIDSFHLVMLAVFIETEFGIRLPDSVVTAQNFDTLSGIMETIDKNK